MKKLMMIAVLFASVTMIAQRGPRQGNDRMGKDLTAEQIATLQTKKMTLELALDNSQSDKIYKVVLAQAKDRKAMMEARKSKDDKPELTKEQRYAQTNERLDKRIAFQKEMKSILTEEQFKKFEKTTAKRGQKGKRSKRGNRGEFSPRDKK